MNEMDMYKMEKILPIELVDLILEFQGYHSWRNGKYIRRFDINDPKYDELKQRPPIQNGKVLFSKMKCGSLYKYEIQTAIYSNKIHWYLDTYWYHSKHQNKKSWNKPYKTSLHYVFEHNEKQHLPMIQI
jgi:hypothetical protein